MMVNSTAVLTDNTIADNMPAGATAGLYAMLRLRPAEPPGDGQTTPSRAISSTPSCWAQMAWPPRSTPSARRPACSATISASLTRMIPTIQQPTGQLDPGSRDPSARGDRTVGQRHLLRSPGQLHAMGTADSPGGIRWRRQQRPASWGGIYINGGTAELYQTRIQNAGRGQDYPTPGPYPSLWVAAGGKLTLFDSTVTDNRTTGQADVGVLVENATASLIHSTFSGLGNPGEADYPLKVSGADSRLDAARQHLHRQRLRPGSTGLKRPDRRRFHPHSPERSHRIRTAEHPHGSRGVSMTVSPGVTLFGRSGAGLVITGPPGGRAKFWPADCVYFNNDHGWFLAGCHL